VQTISIAPAGGSLNQLLEERVRGGHKPHGGAGEVEAEHGDTSLPMAWAVHSGIVILKILRVGVTACDGAHIGDGLDLRRRPAESARTPLWEEPKRGPLCPLSGNSVRQLTPDRGWGPAALSQLHDVSSVLFATAIRRSCRA
jgi:hypothetical protein